MQQGAPLEMSDIRKGSTISTVELEFDGNNFVDKFPSISLLREDPSENCSLFLDARGRAQVKMEARTEKRSTQTTQVPQREPESLIYPILSGRRPHTFKQPPGRTESKTIQYSDQNLVARVSDLLSGSLPESIRFTKLCKEILGINFSTVEVENNTESLGVRISRFESIVLDAMGAGLSSTLSLIAGLSTAHRQLFLIEEPENDLHPRALKALLEAIKETSGSNQFIISTHSNIVLSSLGAVESTVIIEVTSDEKTPPTSNYRPIEGSADRLRVLRDLGYELSDFGLTAGWLIFEESSAELLMRAWLIPTFAPMLVALRTVAASGASRLNPMFATLREMFLFAHLQEIYKDQVWLIADGDKAGIDATEQLKRTYKSWQPSHFQNWLKDDFELYYPSEFGEDVQRVLAITEWQPKMREKGRLAQDVLRWIQEDNERAVSAFSECAAEVIEKLKLIEAEFVRVASTAQEEI